MIVQGALNSRLPGCLSGRRSHTGGESPLEIVSACHCAMLDLVRLDRTALLGHTV